MPKQLFNPNINITNHPDRIDHLINIFNEGGTDQARITKKDDLFFYSTELEDIGVMYIMDDFGDAVKVTWEIWGQHAYIHPPLAELT